MPFQLFAEGESSIISTGSSTEAPVWLIRLEFRSRQLKERGESWCYLSTRVLQCNSPNSKMLQLERGVDTYHMISHEPELGRSLGNLGTTMNGQRCLVEDLQ